MSYIFICILIRKLHFKLNHLIYPDWITDAESFFSDDISQFINQCRVMEDLFFKIIVLLNELENVANST